MPSDPAVSWGPDAVEVPDFPPDMPHTQRHRATLYIKYSFLCKDQRLLLLFKRHLSQNTGPGGSLRPTLTLPPTLPGDSRNTYPAGQCFQKPARPAPPAQATAPQTYGSHKHFLSPRPVCFLLSPLTAPTINPFRRRIPKPSAFPLPSPSPPSFTQSC